MNTNTSTTTPVAALTLPGIHHVTAIAGDPKRNVDFYTRVLGLRLVKKTVNFDDPGTYHLYYGDSVGTPGSILTFFPWAGIRRGRPGNGQVYATAFSVPAGSLRFWEARLLSHGVTPTQSARFGDEVLTFTDPDGLILELVATTEPDARAAYPHPEIAADQAIRGFHGVTIAVIDAARTQSLLTGTMAYRVTRAEGGRTRLAASGAGGPGTYVDLLVDSSLPRGLQGAGTVHHLAFQTPDDATQAHARETLVDLGYHVSPVMDRNYFHSIYYREPEGVLFEIATNHPGFTVDEPAATLGQSLKLPAQYESNRSAIEANLPSLT